MSSTHTVVSPATTMLWSSRGKGSCTRMGEGGMGEREGWGRMGGGKDEGEGGIRS